MQSDESNSLLSVTAIDPETGLPYTENGPPEAIAHRARQLFMGGKIDVAEFERRLDLAAAAEVAAGCAPLDALPTVRD